MQEILNNAVARYDKANSQHAAAKELIQVAEQQLSHSASQNMDGVTMDQAWQETLNHATQRVPYWHDFNISTLLSVRGRLLKLHWRRATRSRNTNRRQMILQRLTWNTVSYGRSLRSSLRKPNLTTPSVQDATMS